MDAYDEDPGAVRGPDGSAGARPPEKPDEPDRTERSGIRPDTSERSESHPDTSERPRRHPDASEGSEKQGGEPTHEDSTDEDSTDEDSTGADSMAQEPPRRGLAALSPRYQVVAALAVAAIVVGVGVHLLMVFLSVAPQNTVSKQHGKAVEEWVFPEFEQNWKLFAPNPLQQNVAVQVRADVRMKDGSVRTTGWTDLSAQDGAAIVGNPAPSHTQQNELRRAWDFLTATHTADNRPVGMRGALSEEYLRRIVVMRLYRTDPTSELGVIQRVQVRSCTLNVQPPSWSHEQVSDKPMYRVLPWWTVSADEAAGGVR
ncbi:DUF5819 family protein [Streptomyces sp. NPDC048106]|uniref:DUF5819 family protein n=1 Tax=Streptomyces sp. NPDC048106 TaxID=3155750 RepID=UPI003454F4BC